MSWSIKFTSSTNPAVGTFISGTITSFGKVVTVPVPEYGLNSATGNITFNNWRSISGMTAIVAKSNINSFQLLTGSNPSTPQQNYLNTTTCMGYITTSSATVNGVSVPGGTFIITVSNGGATVTISDFSPTVNLPAFTIELRKV